MSNPSTKEKTIEGRCFVIFADDEGRLTVDYQGNVLALLPGERMLVQFFEQLLGEPVTMAIVPLATAALRGGREPGGWEFFENAKHLRHWLHEGHGRRYFD